MRDELVGDVALGGEGAHRVEKVVALVESEGDHLAGSRETGNSKRGCFAAADCSALRETASAMEMKRRVTSALSAASSGGARACVAPNFSAATSTFSPS